MLAYAQLSLPEDSMGPDMSGESIKDSVTERNGVVI
jgi:hypothetical protein